MAKLSRKRAWGLGIVGLAVFLFLVGGAGLAVACTKTSLNCHIRPDDGAGLELTAGEISLPDGFSAQAVTQNLVVPTDFDFFPDGRILVGERSGIVRRLSADGSGSTVVVDVRRKVNDAFFRGLVAVAVDPDFDENGYVYVVYTARRPGTPHDSRSRPTSSSRGSSCRATRPAPRRSSSAPTVSRLGVAAYCRRRPTAFLPRSITSAPTSSSHPTERCSSPRARAADRSASRRRRSTRKT